MTLFEELQLFKKAFKISCGHVTPCEHLSEEECKELVKEKQYSEDDPCPECRMDFYLEQSKTIICNTIPS